MSEPRSDRRRIGLPGTLQLVALALTIAAVIWAGGQMAEELRTVGRDVAEVKQTVRELQNGSGDVRELKARASALEKSIDNHEARITRVEGLRRP